MPFFNLYSHLMHPVKSFANSNPFWKSLRTMKGAPWGKLKRAWRVGFKCHNFSPVVMQWTMNERDLLRLNTTWDSSKSKKSISDRVQLVWKRWSGRISKPFSKSIRLNSNNERPSPTLWVFLSLLHTRSLFPCCNRIWEFIDSNSPCLTTKSCEIKRNLWEKRFNQFYLNKKYHSTGYF